MNAPWTIVDAEIERRHAEMLVHFQHSGYRPTPPSRQDVIDSLLLQELRKLLPEWAQVNIGTPGHWLDSAEANRLSTEAIQSAIDAVGLGPDGDANVEILLDNTESWISYSADPNGGFSSVVETGRTLGSEWALRCHPDAFDALERFFPGRQGIKRLSGVKWAARFSGFRSDSDLDSIAYEVETGRPVRLRAEQLEALRRRFDDVIACWGRRLSDGDVELIRSAVEIAEVIE